MVFMAKEWKINYIMKNEINYVMKTWNVIKKIIIKPKVNGQLKTYLPNEK